MKVLVTGGTVFVSKYVARYYVNKGYEVYVLNRNSRPQIDGVHLLEADRHDCKDVLKGHYFDAVLDVTAYTAEDIKDLIAGLEGFVFECAEKGRKFYIPKDGSMQLQFFHVEDLCKVMDAILEKEPAEHILNVGNEETISILDWVKMCYDVVGAPFNIVNVDESIEQRKYFSFYDYEYKLEVSRQKALLNETMDLRDGLQGAYEWYKNNKSEVRQKDFIAFIDENLQLF